MRIHRDDLYGIKNVLIIDDLVIIGGTALPVIKIKQMV